MKSSAAGFEDPQAMQTALASDRAGEATLRVVVAGPTPPTCAGLAPEEILAYSLWKWPLVWLRLMLFLGWSRNVRVACLASRGGGALKLLAFALRGRVDLLLPGRESLSLRLGSFLWLALKTFGRRSGDICLIGTADRPLLERIIAGLRQRYPGAAIHALVPAGVAPGLNTDTLAPLTAGSLWRASRRRPRFGVIAIPHTGEGGIWPKLLAWFMPLGWREIYNENCDFYSPREVNLLLLHAWKRIRPWERLLLLFSIPNRVTVLGAASPERLRGIVAGVRDRYPDAPVHGLLPQSMSAHAQMFDSTTILGATSVATYRDVLALSFGRRRAGHYVFPLTGEGASLLKLFFWCLPLGRREFHNEHGSFCDARDFSALVRHLSMRRPHRVTVLGSASGLYLKTIVGDLRRRYPGAPIHGLLPGRLVVPVAHLFDSYSVACPGSARFWGDVASRSFGRRRSGHYVIPCTNEGYTLLKLAAAGLPLGLREVYNENGDAYYLRHLRMLARHTFWRLRHRIFYQALTELNGRFWLLHLAHLALYPARLTAGALVLAHVRLRVRWRSRFGVGAHSAPVPVRQIPVATHVESGAPVASGDP